MQKEKIYSLEARVTLMEKYIGKLEQRVDDQEQYNHRLCLRIDGIPTVEDSKTESDEQYLEKVKQIFKMLAYPTLLLTGPAELEIVIR